LAAAVVKQCEDVVKRHEAAALQEYVDDGTFRALVSEMLDAKAWAKEKKELWMRDAVATDLLSARLVSARSAIALWSVVSAKKPLAALLLGRLRRHFASLELLSSRGLVLQGVDEKNADGEDVMVQAGGDGLAPRCDIAAQLHAAGAACCR